MPVQYTAGTIKEHKAVRDADSQNKDTHKGETKHHDNQAREIVGKLTTNAVESAPVGKAVYTLLCRPNGGIVDDCIFYKRDDREFFVIVNASNQRKDLEWFRDHANEHCNVEDVSVLSVLIAVQGPKAVAMIDALPGDKAGQLAAMPSFTFTDAEIAGVKCVAARTGYTGEDGFELACANSDAVALWSALLEAALPLGGNDIDDDHTPLEAGLGWAVKLDKGDFLGREALQKQKAAGRERRVVGFTIDPALRAVARHGYAVVENGVTVGNVTSGGPGISVAGAVGLAFVPVRLAAPGTQNSVDCRGQPVAAQVVSGKFYKRAK